MFNRTTSPRVAAHAGIGLAALAIGSTAVIPAASAAPAAHPSRPSNTFSSAYPFKTAHKVGNRWTVKVVKVIRNANAACKEADPTFYSNPKKGYQWVVVDFTMKNLVAKKKSMGEDITFVLATSGLKHQYPQTIGIVAPNDASATKPVGKGQSVTGAYTFQVRKSDVSKVRVAAQDDMVLTIQYFKL